MRAWNVAWHWLQRTVPSSFSLSRLQVTDLLELQNGQENTLSSLSCFFFLREVEGGLSRWSSPQRTT